MRELSVREGTLLFEGFQINDRYSGTAFTFIEDCQPIPYHVEGTWYRRSNDYLLLRGPAPDEYSGCRGTSYNWNHNSELEFDRVGSGSPGYPPY